MLLLANLGQNHLGKGGGFDKIYINMLRILRKLLLIFRFLKFSDPSTPIGSHENQKQKQD